MSKRSYCTFEKGLHAFENEVFDSLPNVECSRIKRSRQNTSEEKRVTFLDDLITTGSNAHHNVNLRILSEAEGAFADELRKLNINFLRFFTHCITEDSCCLVFTSFNEYMEQFTGLMKRYLTNYPQSETTQHCLKVLRAYCSSKFSHVGLYVGFTEDSATNTDIPDSVGQNLPNELSNPFPSKLKDISLPSFTPSFVSFPKRERITWNRKRELYKEMQSIANRPLSYAVPRPTSNKVVVDPVFTTNNTISKHFDFGPTDCQLKQVVENPSKLGQISITDRTASNDLPKEPPGTCGKRFTIKKLVSDYFNRPSKYSCKSFLKKNPNPVSDQLWTCDACKKLNRYADVSCHACGLSRDSRKKDDQDTRFGWKINNTKEMHIPPILFSKSVANVSEGPIEKKAVENVAIPQRSEQSNGIDWICHICHKSNKPSSFSCIHCHAKRAEEKLLRLPKTDDFKFAGSTVQPFKFGLSKPERNNTEVKLQNNETDAPSTFKLVSSIEKFGSDTWECPTCLVTNRKTLAKCPCCDTSNPNSAPTSSLKSQGGFEFSKSTWICTACLNINKNDGVLSCAKCSAQRNHETKAPRDFSSLFKSEVGFSFTKPATSCSGTTSDANVGASLNLVTTSSSTLEQPKFQFSLPKSLPSFALSVPKENMSVVNEKADEGDDDNYEPPEVVEIEHKEDGAIFYKKCKMYYLDKNSKYRLKANGFINVLVTSSKPSFLFRANDACGTVILSVNIIKDTKPTVKDKNVTILSFAYPKFYEDQDESKPLILLFKFKSASDAEEFSRVIEQNV